MVTSGWGGKGLRTESQNMWVEVQLSLTSCAACEPQFPHF